MCCIESVRASRVVCWVALMLAVLRALPLAVLPLVALLLLGLPLVELLSACSLGGH